MIHGAHLATPAEGERVHVTLRVTDASQLEPTTSLRPLDPKRRYCRVLHNGTEIYSVHSQGTFNRFSVAASVAIGDILDLAIDPDGAGNLALGGINTVNDGCDGTFFVAAIEGSAGPSEDCAADGDEDLDGKADCLDEDCASERRCLLPQSGCRSHRMPSWWWLRMST